MFIRGYDIHHYGNEHRELRTEKGSEHLEIKVG